MSANKSRHFLPMSSMIFKSSPNLRSTLSTNPTLVNLREAEDTSITALPMTATTEHKKGIWSRIVAKIKVIFGSKDKEQHEEQRELEIGSPTDFEHHTTGGFGPLRTPVKQRVSEEDDWEDLEATRSI